MAWLQPRQKNRTGDWDYPAHKAGFVSSFVYNNPPSSLHKARFLRLEHFVSKLHIAQHESFLSFNCLLIIMSPLLCLFLNRLIPKIYNSQFYLESPTFKSKFLCPQTFCENCKENWKSPLRSKVL